jgi:hypothetical protein
VTGYGVPDGDMPSLPWPLRQDESKMTDAALAALLAGKESPADAVAGLQPVADVLASLRAGPSSEELAGEASAMTEFRRVTGVSAQTQLSHRRRPSVLSSLLKAKVAAAAVVLLGAAATAAYANVLPASLQRLAHDAIDAPAAAGSHPDAHPAKTGTPVGPNAAGKAAFGLCTAFADAKDHGNATQKAVAFRNLAKAAGGAGNIATYCASVPHPGASSPAGQASGHATGKPSAHPTAHAHPTPHAQPTPHPTGQPAAHPTPHPTGQPAANS